MQADDFETCCDRLSALAEETRLRIVHRLLAGGPTFVTALARELNVDIVKASHHLRILRDAGILQNQRQGKFIQYSIRPGVLTGGNQLDLGCCQVWLQPIQAP